MDTLKPLPNKAQTLVRTAKNISHSTIGGLTAVVSAPIVGLLPNDVRTEFHNFVLPNSNIKSLNNLAGISSLVAETALAYQLYENHPFLSGLVALDPIIRTSGTFMKIAGNYVLPERPEEVEIERSHIYCDILGWSALCLCFGNEKLEKIQRYFKDQYSKAYQELLRD